MGGWHMRSSIRNVFLTDIDEEVETLLDILEIRQDGLKCPGKTVQPLGPVWSVNYRIQRNAFTAIVFLSFGQ